MQLFWLSIKVYKDKKKLFHSRSEKEWTFCDEITSILLVHIRVERFKFLINISAMEAENCFDFSDFVIEFKS